MYRDHSNGSFNRSYVSPSIRDRWGRHTSIVKSIGKYRYNDFRSVSPFTHYIYIWVLIQLSAHLFFYSYYFYSVRFRFVGILLAQPVPRRTPRRPTACRCRIPIYNTHVGTYLYSLLSAAASNVCAHNIHTTRLCRYDILLFMHVKRHALGVPSFCTIECRDNAPWQTGEDIVATQI